MKEIRVRLDGTQKEGSSVLDSCDDAVYIGSIILREHHGILYK